jgi:hypothetical protein
MGVEHVLKTDNATAPGCASLQTFLEAHASMSDNFGALAVRGASAPRCKSVW